MGCDGELSGLGEATGPNAGSSKPLACLMDPELPGKMRIKKCKREEIKFYLNVSLLLRTANTWKWKSGLREWSGGGGTAYLSYHDQLGRIQKSRERTMDPDGGPFTDQWKLVIRFKGEPQGIGKKME